MATGLTQESAREGAKRMLAVNERISNRRGKKGRSRRNPHEKANAAKEQAE